MEKSYHHGNLKNDLIEAGIEIVSSEGPEALSMRKLAKILNVSHNAPFRHFEDREALMQGICNYIASKFEDTISEVALSNHHEPDAVVRLSIRYVKFFVENPSYFRVLTSANTPVQIFFSREKISASERLPLKILQNAISLIVDVKSMKPEDLVRKTIALWSMLQGLCTILTSSECEFHGDVDSFIESLVREEFMSKCVFK